MKTVLASDGGGHLKQLMLLQERIDIDLGDVLWITYDSPQSRSVLSSTEVFLLPYVRPRDWKGVAKNASLVRRRLRHEKVDIAVSTGARSAISVLPQLRLKGVYTHYIESAARALAPSLSGRMIAASRAASLYTQYEGLQDRRWRFRGNVFEAFEPASLHSANRVLNRVVVTLGTEDFGFPRLVRQLVKIIPPDVEVLWQTGATDTTGLDIDPVASLPARELEMAIAEADVVVSHAGCGSALTSLEAGRQPLLVPRRVDRGEHIDDHQTQIAHVLAGRGLARCVEADAVGWSDLVAASRGAVRRVAHPPPFRLDPMRHRRRLAWRRGRSE